MSTGDLRTLVLIGGLVLAGITRMPQLAFAAVSGVAFWHGYDIGKTFGAPGGLSNTENLGALLLLGFFATMLLLIWGITVRQRRQGKTPFFPPRYVLLVLGFTVAGFGTGAFASTVLGPSA